MLLKARAFEIVQNYGHRGNDAPSQNYWEIFLQVTCTPENLQIKRSTFRLLAAMLAKQFNGIRKLDKDDVLI